MADKLTKRYVDTLKSKGCKENQPRAPPPEPPHGHPSEGGQHQGCRERGPLLTPCSWEPFSGLWGRWDKGRWLRGRDGLKGSHCPMPSPHHRADCALREENPLPITQIMPGSLAGALWASICLEGALLAGFHRGPIGL